MKSQSKYVDSLDKPFSQGDMVYHLTLWLQILVVGPVIRRSTDTSLNWVYQVGENHEHDLPSLKDQRSCFMAITGKAYQGVDHLAKFREILNSVFGPDIAENACFNTLDLKGKEHPSAGDVGRRPFSGAQAQSAALGSGIYLAAKAGSLHLASKSKRFLGSQSLPLTPWLLFSESSTGFKQANSLPKQ